MTFNDVVQPGCTPICTPFSGLKTFSLLMDSRSDMPLDASSAADSVYHSTTT